jgi:hypothetical protein
MSVIEEQINNLPTEWAIKKVGDICKKPQYGYTATETS